MSVFIGCNYCGEKLPDGEGHVCVPVEAAVTGREELAKENSGLISMLRSRSLELRDWRTGHHNLPHGLPSALLDAERRLEQAADALTVTATRVAEVKAAAWDEGADSRQCHCAAWGEGECACGNYPSERNPYRRTATPEGGTP